MFWNMFLVKWSKYVDVLWHVPCNHLLFLNVSIITFCFPPKNLSIYFIFGNTTSISLYLKDIIIGMASQANAISLFSHKALYSQQLIYISPLKCSKICMPILSSVRPCAKASITGAEEVIGTYVVCSNHSLLASSFNGLKNILNRAYSTTHKQHKHLQTFIHINYNSLCIYLFLIEITYFIIRFGVSLVNHQHQVVCSRSQFSPRGSSWNEGMIFMSAIS